MSYSIFYYLKQTFFHTWAKSIFLSCSVYCSFLYLFGFGFVFCLCFGFLFKIFVLQSSVSSVSVSLTTTKSRIKSTSNDPKGQTATDFIIDNVLIYHRDIQIAIAPDQIRPETEQTDHIASSSHCPGVRLISVSFFKIPSTKRGKRVSFQRRLS